MLILDSEILKLIFILNYSFFFFVADKPYLSNSINMESLGYVVIFQAGRLPAHHPLLASYLIMLYFLPESDLNLLYRYSIERKRQLEKERIKSVGLTDTFTL